MTPEKEKELLRLASRGAPMPDGMPLEQQQAYQALRWLYALYGMKRLTKEAAAREKERILSELRKAESTREFYDRITEYRVKAIRETEAALTEYRKNRSLEAADGVVRAFQGVPCTVPLPEGKEA